MVLTHTKSARARSTRRLTGVAIAAAVASAFLVPLSATAAEATEFHSSFEADDAAPTLTGTGAAVNVTGDRFVPGSLLSKEPVATASDENPPNETVDKLADGNSGSKWLVFAKQAWAQYEFSEAAPVTRYTLTSGNDASERDPKDFTLQASNDGTEWTTIDTRTGEVFAGRGEERSFTLEAPSDPYLFYRLNITANQSGNLIQLAGWDLIETEGAAATPSDLALTVDSGPKTSHTAKTNVGFTGTKALNYTGRHIDAGAASSSSILYDDVDIAVESDSALSYLVFPQLDGEQTYAATFVAVDLTFDNGEKLSASGAVDSYGYAANARAQGQANKLWPDQWNKVTVDLGEFAGRTVTEISLSYDHPGDDVHAVEVPTADTPLTGWLDDIEIGPREERDTTDGLVSYVDTRRGTNSTGGFSRGNNIPATAWPNGFNFITPMTDADNHGTLYNYQRSNNAQNRPGLNGIGFSHEPSIWMGDRNQLAVIPAANADPTSNLDDRSLTFSHENETARPDVYRVAFDNGIDTEVTATDHGAIYRFTFAGDVGSVLIDQVVADSKLTIDGNTVSGWVDGGSGWPGRSRMFVHGTFDAASTVAGPTTKGDRDSARYAAFDTSSDKTVELRIASSFISQDQAAANYGFELDGVSFDDAHAAVSNEWNDRLSVVHDVKGATDAQLVNLYSSLYRLNLYPNSQFENTGTEADPDYKYASPVSAKDGNATDTETNAKIVDGKIYVNNGFWDTYRTAWPLYSLLYPEQTEELVDGFVQQYRDGGWIARWSSPGYADLMTGTSSDVAFAEAYLAGSLETDTALEAYDAAVKNATVLPESNAVGRKGLAQSIFLGFTPESTHQSASWGLEGFINDFGIAEMAAALAEDPETPADRVDQLREEATYFEARAQHYAEMYNPDAGVFTARNADGSWAEDADFDKKAWGGAFTEASGWTFAFHAPHDVDGLAALYGGRQGLVDELHSFLTVREMADHSGIHEAREARDVRLGMLGMSNQVAHHIPYVLAEAGDPTGAQELIHDIQKRLFVGSDIGQGYAGDEDNGEFSAWYVFSALGFFPLEVGSGNYTIGTPLFDSATLSIGDTDVVINAEGASDGNKYVDGVTLDGEPLTETTFDGALLRDGGELNFSMSDSPSSWGAKDLSEELEVPDVLVDATKPSLGTLKAADGTVVDALVDDNMNSSVTLDGGADLVWTSKSGPVSVSQYTLTSRALESAPASWTLSGSTDGETWVELDAREGEAYQWDTQTRPFTASGTGSYTSFRLEIAGEGDALSLAEVELFAAAGEASELSLTSAGDQHVAVDTLFDEAVATIVGTETDAAAYDVTVDYGDGTEVEDITLNKDELGGWQVVAPHTFTAPGVYTASVSVVDSSGATASTSTSIHVERDDTFVGALNNVCIGDLGETAANCDSQGHGYFRDKLAADGFAQGDALTIPGTELSYLLPDVAPGEPDNITGEGQTVRIDLGDGATQMAFVGTATESNRQSDAVLHFSDGTEQTVSISLGDWVGASSKPVFDNTVLAVSEGRLSGISAESSIKNTAIYATAPVPLDVDENGAPKVVESLTMPKEEGSLGDGRVHVFAIASDADPSTVTPLAVEAAEVETQLTGESFEATLATTTGGAGDATAVVNWGDGSPVSSVEVVDGAIVGEHTYAEAGTHQVSVTVDDGVLSVTATLEIVVEEPEPPYAPEITLGENAAAPGDTVAVTGTGFAPGESVALRFGSEDAVTVEADADGNVAGEVTVPEDAVDGEYPITALGKESNIEAAATLQVKAAAAEAEATSVALTTDADDVVAGDLVSLMATVDPAEAAGSVEFVEGEMVIGTASVSGGVAIADVEIATSGAHTFVARFVPADPEAFLGSQSEPLTIEVRSAPVLEAEIELSTDTVVQGGSFELIGRGFAGGEQVTIDLHSDPIQLATATADGSGSFRIQVTVPVTVQPG
ncbi:MAG: GH92 family glycosyl hydrolase, partial [Microbacterium sp.]|uniref:GH92 family glycosyl hydrolase n=1 Tax=Microbacterium sp. TaxID=51671 RepID=UPI003F988DA4